MNMFNSNWLTEGLLDEEYKQYMLLAWLKKWQSEFEQVKLYPAIDALSQQQQDLMLVLNQFKEMENNLPSEVIGLNFGERKLIRQHVQQPSEFTAFLERMVSFALPKIQAQLNEGAQIQAFVADQLKLEPIGVLPLYKNEGYVLLQTEQSKALSLYRFSLSMIELVENRVHRLQLHLIERKTKSSFQTLEQLKLELIKKFNDLPNPATFVLHSKLHFPEMETLVPLCRSMLVKELSLRA